MGLFTDNRVWHITNTDTGETIDGDFEAENVTRNVQSNYARKKALNRQTPITQYLNGEADTVSFQGRVFRRDITGGAGLFGLFGGGSPQEKLQKLIEWTKRDSSLNRPPIVLFYVGNGDPIYGDFFSVIDSISNISYDDPVSTGDFRGATFTINLSQYSEDFTIDNTPPPETRYHRAKAGEYYELIAQREYQRPELGDVIRKRHPDTQLIQAGNVIKLPSLDAIRATPVVPTSLPLKGLTSNRDSPQKTLREYHLDRLNRTRISVTVPEGL